MCMGMRNVGFPSLPWDSHGKGTKLFKLMGMEREMGIAQMGMGTLIINVFPFSDNFLCKIWV